MTLSPMSSLFLYLFSVFAILPLTSCQSLNAPTSGEMIIFATDPDPRIEFGPSTPDIWHPLVQGSNHTALITNDPRASVFLILYGSAVTFYCADLPSFPPLLATFDGMEFNITPNRTIEVPLGSTGAGTVNHTIVLRRSPDASNESFWNVLAFGITPTSDFPPLLAKAMRPPAAQHAYSSRDLNDYSPHILGTLVVMGVLALLFAGVAIIHIIWTYLRRRCQKRKSCVATPNPLIVNRVIRNESFPQATSEMMVDGDRTRSSLQNRYSTNIGSMTVDAGSSRGSTVPPTYLSRDESSRVTSGRPPTYLFQENMANRVPMSEIRAEEVLSRNATLASVNPPPSYRSEERRSIAFV